MNQTLKIILIVIGSLMGLVVLAGIVLLATHKTSQSVYSQRTFLKAPTGNPHLTKAYQYIDDFSNTSLDDKQRVKHLLGKIHDSLSQAYPSGEIPQDMLTKHEYNWEKRMSSQHFFKLNDIFQS